jgi:hypothetical protein
MNDRTHLNFANVVTKAFAFLSDLGFVQIESLPTLVRYRKGDIEVNVYHGRQSYELACEIVRQGRRYSLGQIIDAIDSEVARKYRHFAATTPEGVARGIAQLEELARRYSELALRGDPQFFATLEDQGVLGARAFALDVLAGQLRPKADAAFRRGDYRQAAELYEQFRPRLSVAELKKLAYAKKRAGL